MYRCPKCREINIKVSSAEKERKNLQTLLDNANAKICKNNSTIQLIQEKEKENKDEIKALRAEIEKVMSTNKNLVDQLDKKQKNLDSLSNQQAKLKKDVTAAQRKNEADTTKIEDINAGKKEKMLHIVSLPR